jgi:hypothetical protein
VLKWTVEADEAFESIKRAIDACQTIFFLHNDASGFLQTDASDDGVSSYLFQRVQERYLLHPYLLQSDFSSRNVSIQALNMEVSSVNAGTC